MGWLASHRRCPEAQRDHPGDGQQVVGGGAHSCALLTGGRVRCWGYAEFGALGHGNINNIGDNEDPAAAGDVDIGGTVVQLAGSSYHTCALLDTGAVRCWGENDNGQLGYGHTDTIGDDETPASAGDVDPFGPFPVMDVTAGYSFTCALSSAGQLKCFGAAFAGELGYGHVDFLGDDETPADTPHVCIVGPCKGTLSNPAASCKGILLANPNAGDGVYAISGAGTTLSTHCDMTRDSGGWTLVMAARRANPTGWGTAGDLNLSELRSPGTSLLSAKANDAFINAMRSEAYRVESLNCSGIVGDAETVVYFQPACAYAHDAQATGVCADGYTGLDFLTAVTPDLNVGFQGLTNYSIPANSTTSVITHDPVSGLGNDSWWTGGANRCDMEAYVR